MPRAAPASAAKDLTAKEIAVAASGGGFRGDDLVTAVAIGLAESGGAATAIGGPNSNGTYDYGVWQINSVHRDLFDRYPDWWVPVQNARMAHAVFQASGFRAWTTFKLGLHVPFLVAAKAAADELTVIPDEDDIITETPFDPLINIANGILGIAQAFFKAAVWVANPQNWVRIAFALVGGALIVGGLVVVARSAGGKG